MTEDIQKFLTQSETTEMFVKSEESINSRIVIFKISSAPNSESKKKKDIERINAYSYQQF